MNLTWISEKSTGLVAIVIGLGFLGIAYLDAHYRYFHLAVALAALYFGYRRITRQETPFERRERELRRHFR
jgi:hypothetical protein